MIGSEGEVDQYKTMAETYAPLSRHVTVKVESWPNDAAMLGAFRDGAPVPDVFLANRRHLAYLVQHQLVQPVDQLLDDRGFDFGDEFPRGEPDGVRQRQPPGVPAVRRAALGRLLQQEAGQAGAAEERPADRRDRAGR